MRFEPLTTGAGEPDALKADYARARRIGKLRLGTDYLFFKSGLKAYYIPYTDIRRYFRRVMFVPAKLCCGMGSFTIERLVLCGESGELAQIQLPDTHAAKAVMAAMAELAPDAAVGRAEKETDEE